MFPNCKSHVHNKIYESKKAQMTQVHSKSYDSRKLKWLTIRNGGTHDISLIKKYVLFTLCSLRGIIVRMLDDEIDRIVLFYGKNVGG